MRTKIRYIFLAVCATVALPAAPGSAAPDTADVPKIATYNTFMLPTSLYPNWGQDTRADLIANQKVVAGQDVVVFQELFANGASERLLSNLAAEYPHQTPVVGRSRSGWDETLGAYSSTVLEDGGTAIVSRWPIARKVQYVYTEACGADWHSNKGFAYVKVLTPTGPLHVIGTHTQAQDSSCSATTPEAVRTNQRTELRNFMAEQKIPANEPLYVAGDMNTIESGPEYKTMIAELGAVAPTHTGHKYSWDCKDNTICVDQYGADYASEQLDYILPISGHPVPASYINEVRRVKSPEWTTTSWGTTYKYTDYSDHYPVFGYGRSISTGSS